MWFFYWLALHLAGLKPKRIVPPLEEGDLEGLDGLIIGGGDDIGAHLYNGKPELDVSIDPGRDSLEMEALKRADRKDLPILGVCRGCQILNVFRGGSLHQDIYEFFQGVPRMRTSLPKKKVKIKQGSKLSSIMMCENCYVNSIHHQSINKTGENLEVAARDEFGIVQAVEDKQSDFVLGVQWHPEFLIYRKDHRMIFRKFAEAVKAKCES